MILPWHRYWLGSCLASLLLLVAPGCEPSGSGVAKLGEITVPDKRDASNYKPRVDRPYFNSQGWLRWDDSVLKAPAISVCKPGMIEYQRETLMLNPRVDKFGCARVPLKDGNETAYLLTGFDEADQIAWLRPLSFISGKYTFDERVAGASAEGIVLGDLTVISPRTGETLVPAPTQPLVGADDKPVPIHRSSFVYSTIYLSNSRRFVFFDAEVSLFDSEGGLYLFDPQTGKKELLLEVATTWLRGYWQVQEMALSSDQRYLLLAQEKTNRGPSKVAFAVYDLTQRRMIFEEFYDDPSDSEPKIVAGTAGNIGFSYHDGHAQRFVLVHYRVPLDSSQ